MLSIKVNAKLFAATARTISTEEARYYLCGVFFEANPNGGVTMVATNGHTMTVAHDPDGTIEGTDGAIMKVDKTVLTAAKKAHMGNMIFTSDVATVYAHNSDTIAGAMGPCLEIDGRFPDWRRVVPQYTDPKGQAAQDHHGYLGATLQTILDTAKILGGKKASFTINAVGAKSPELVLYESTDQIFSVLMPCRTSKEALSPPFEY